MCLRVCKTVGAVGQRREQTPVNRFEVKRVIIYSRAGGTTLITIEDPLWLIATTHQFTMQQTGRGYCCSPRLINLLAGLFRPVIISFFIALIQPHWLTGRKAASYLLTVYFFIAVRASLPFVLILLLLIFFIHSS